MQPFDHLASGTVRSFELVYSRGSTEILLSARTLDDMGRYADLFSQVYGEMALQKADSVLLSLQGLRQSLVSWSEEPEPRPGRSTSFAL